MSETPVIDQITAHLQKYGWQKFQAVPEIGEAEGVVMTGWSMNPGDPASETHALAIDPIVEKNALQFRARNVLKAPPDSTAADRLSGLLLAMSALNYKLIIGNWAYDPRDGEVLFRFGLPLHTKILSYEDFEHCLNVIIAAVEVDGAKLKEVIAGTKTGHEVAVEEGLGIGQSPS
jgi:hypothetical protein